MQLPVDIKALIDETTDIKAAHDTEIAVSVYMDESAPAGLTAHVRSAFASSLPSVRMTLSYLDGNFIPQPTDDIAVIVAGASDEVGACAAQLRAVGVPVMVVAAEEAPVAERAQKAGHPIPHGDIICPKPLKEPDVAKEAKAVVDQASRGVPAERWRPEGMRLGRHGVVTPAPAETGFADSEQAALELTEERLRSLDESMGRWIVSVCREKRLAYAIAFPFVRRPLARDAVQATALQNAAVGLVPFLPGADLPIMTLNQAKMVLQIGAAYGQPMDKGRWKEVGAVVAAAYLSRGLARRLVAMVPVLGFAVRAGVAYGLTAAMGYGVIEYFEGGQNVTGVANVVERTAGTASRVLGKARDAAQKYLPIAAGTVVSK